MTTLFEPFKLKDVVIRNRIAVPPMCQYMANEGFPTDWHGPHLTGLGRGGAGLVILEATAVSPEGRITPNCLGIWSDAHGEALRPLADAIRSTGAVPGIQLAHAGRKGSANRPWEGDHHIEADDPRGWETIGPSAISFNSAKLPKIPLAMTIADIARVRSDFVKGAVRARDAGFEWLELHFAHGYLGQSFFSSHSNQRTDAYGGSLENRSRFLLETLSAVRKVWPEHLPLAVRFGFVEYDGGDDVHFPEALDIAKQFQANGADFLNVSVGFSTPTAKVPWSPAYLAPVSEIVRRELNMPVGVAWGIGQPALANDILDRQQADLIMVGRPLLANPNWPFRAAQELGVDKPAWTLPAPYAFWLDRYDLTLTQAPR
ncbi:NADH:flavin oxidoreductase/NADH oxidase [Cupriavidus basilensis]|uniref:NADH:flavin oxidoreductase/NADH oxidase n=1 Tax=Cupriavidus basilensis TaxID=68895 RepID=UPI0039F68966